MTQELSKPGSNRSSAWNNRRLDTLLLLSHADIELLNSLRPRCVQCNRLVDRFFWYRSVSELMIVFEAECHGKIEKTHVTFAMLPAIMLGGVHGGEAFTDEPRLTEGG